MTTLAQLRKTALSYPETAEVVSRGGVIGFTVAGARFAMYRDGNVELCLGRNDADAFLATLPAARPIPGFTMTIALTEIDGQQLNHWVRRAWLDAAPKRLSAPALAAEEAVPGTVGDLPKAIGRPATQALVAAGITTLAQVAELSDANLLALHGVGKKAVAVLREAG